jgi:hypothetical protein
VLGPSLVWGPGLGIAIVVVIAAATDDLGGEAESGLASGLVNTTLQVGGAIALAALSTFAFDRVDDAMAEARGDPSALPGALTEGFAARPVPRCGARRGWRPDRVARHRRARRETASRARARGAGARPGGLTEPI